MKTWEHPGGKLRELGAECLTNLDLIEKYGLKGIEYCQLPFEIYKVRG